MIKRYSCLLALIFSFFLCLAQSKSNATDQEQAYDKVVNQRAEKIVSVLNISDVSKAQHVKDIVAARYHQLNDIQIATDEKIKKVKSQNIGDKSALNAEVNNYQKEEEIKIDSSHKDFITDLSKELTPQQVDQVKNGMTYNVLPITYKGYLEMIPELTNEQKEQIMAWLIEARDHAIDAGTSEKKHWWFGKYKGRINNYLSAQGYDLKKEGDDWQKRRDAEKAAAK